MYDETNLANEIYEILKEGKLNIALPMNKILPADWEKDYHFVHRELKHHPTIILDCYFDINNPEDHCGLFAHLIVEAVLKHIEEKETRSSYTVKKGDSLYSIAKTFNTNVNTIMKDNSLGTPALSIGQILKIETKKKEIVTQESCYGESEEIEETPTTYTVQKGDSLYLISKKFNITIGEIIQENNLKSTTLSIGQTLTIPTTSSSSNTFIHTVQKNDSLYSISKKYNTTVARIKELNNLTSNLLSIGQQLTIERMM